MSNHFHAVQDAASAASSALKTTVAGAAAGGLGWLTDSKTIAIAGLLVTLAGFLVNWYYRHKEFRLKQAEFERTRRRDDHA